MRASLFTLVLALLSSNALGAGVLEVGGYARETLPGANMAAAYLTLRNDGDTPRSLQKVELAQFEHGSVSLHTTVSESGVSRMRPLATLPLPAASTVTMAPGGLHLMLSGAELAAGEQVQLRLHFADGEVRLVNVPVRSAAEQAHHHHG
ncbi:copper chaperone PCu(A)C [Microbulbifer sediminum]|uniref:copper chaperone PCu(A)C n=1 Tax=Microbulbifer sediminum TaxID=2904250 RepID=UPI001F297E6C|nr:copper chaperone PCu(A)C [Microbulbifer sediminum]